MKKTKLAFILLLSIAFFQAAVVNRDKPRKGEWDFKLEKVWEIDRAGDDLLGRPFSLTATEDGILYVYDTANDTNYIFLSFVVGFLPTGLIGLVLAAILSASMSSTWVTKWGERYQGL